MIITKRADEKGDISVNVDDDDNDNCMDDDDDESNDSNYIDGDELSLRR